MISFDYNSIHGLPAAERTAPSPHHPNASKPRIVVSGVNLTEMGPLAIFHDALESLAAHYNEQYEIIALVHRRELLNVPNITYLEFPGIKSSWLKRLVFEFLDSKKISERLRPEIWLSMDNVTPRVVAEVQAVYCHNPGAFYRFHTSDILLDWKFSVFTLFFRHLYGINIQSNDYVIVQQSWIRRKFEQFYGVDNVIVAHPTVTTSGITPNHRKRQPGESYRFFYPAFPRTFKNMELILQAAHLLEQRGFDDFELWLTFDGSVNRYAAQMAMRFSQLKMCSLAWPTTSNSRVCALSGGRLSALPFEARDLGAADHRV